MMEIDIFEAVKSKNVEKLKMALHLGANINAKNSDGNTPLHQAVLNKSMEMVVLLIEAGADVNLTNNNDQTPLTLIRGTTDLEMSSFLVKMFVNAGADVNVTFEGTMNNYLGPSLLHIAAKNWDLDLVQFLLSQGANVNASSKLNLNTVLHTVLEFLDVAIFRNKLPADPVPMLEVLLSAGADPNARDELGDVPLHELFLCNSKVPEMNRILKLFKRYGADFDAVNVNGIKFIDCAIWLSNVEAVKELILNYGVDPNSKYVHEFNPGEQRESNDESILHGACCERESLPVVKFLIKRGAKIEKLDGDNRSILKCVIDSFDDTIESDPKFIEDCNQKIKYLLKKNVSVNTIAKGNLNVLSPRSENELPDGLWEPILEHVAKLQAINKPVHESLIKTISNNPKYKNYFTKCNNELARAKNSILHINSWVTFFHLLTDNERKLVQYTGNKDLAKNFEARMICTTEFPIYGSLIQERVLKAVKYRSILEKAGIKLSELLPISVEPENWIISKILSFLSNKDLKKLCQ